MTKLDKIYYDREAIIATEILQHLENDVRSVLVYIVHIHPHRIPTIKLEDKDTIIATYTIRLVENVKEEQKNDLLAYIKKRINKEIDQNRIVIDNESQTINLDVTIEEILAIYKYIYKASCYKIKAVKTIRGMCARYTYSRYIYPCKGITNTEDTFKRYLLGLLYSRFKHEVQFRCEIGCSPDKSNFALYILYTEPAGPILPGRETRNEDICKLFYTTFGIQNPDIYEALDKFEDIPKCHAIQYNLSGYEYDNLKALSKIITCNIL